MKTLVVLFILGLVAFGAIYWLTMKASEDPGYSFALAFGLPDDQGNIEMHVIIYGRTVRIDPPRLDPKTGVELWSEWVTKHFDLRDDKGANVAFMRHGGSAVITGKDVGAGTPDFYLIAKVKKGANYVFDYLPTPVDGERFRYNFTAPTDPQPVKRPLFPPVTETANK